MKQEMSDYWICKHAEKRCESSCMCEHGSAHIKNMCCPDGYEGADALKSECPPCKRLTLTEYAVLRLLGKTKGERT